MPVDSKRLAQFTTVDDNVKRMVLALPAFSVGDAVHATFVNKLEGSVPGNVSQMFGTGARFVDVFFPGWRPLPLTEQVAGLTFPDAVWTSFAVVVLVQSMDAQTRDLRPQLKHAEINSQVTVLNASLNAVAYRLYSQAMAQLYDDFCIPFRSSNHDAARAQYEQLLRDTVSIADLWFASGVWKNPDWVLFHHCVKLLALGASTQEIDALIAQLQQLGLHVPPGIANGAWRGFTQYLQNAPAVTHSDIDAAASNGIMEATYPPSFGRGPPPAMREGNSFEFTANGQPGSGYRQPPGGSCFSADTMVLAADGTALPIAQVGRGTVLATPSGPRPAAFLVATTAGGRDLYTIDNLPFAVTAAHPFVSAAPETGQFLAVDPGLLRHWGPTHARAGAGQLQPGARLVTHDGGEAVVARLDRRAPASPDEPIYDVVMAPDGTGRSAYFAGAAGRFFGVGSEMPDTAQSPAATIALERLLATVSQSLAARPALGQTPPPAALEMLGRLASGSLLPLATSRVAPLRLTANAAMTGAAMTGAAMTGAAMTGAALAATATQAVGRFVQADQDYNQVLGRVFAAVIASCGLEIEDAIATGYRHAAAADGPLLAVALGGLILEAEAPLVAGEAFAVQVTVSAPGIAAVTSEITVPAGTGFSLFARSLDAMAYLEIGSVPAGVVPLLEVTLAPSGRPAAGVSAKVWLPDLASLSYRWLHPRLTGADGAAAGSLTCGLRRVTAAARGAEEAARPGWNQAARMQYAGALGSAMGEVLGELIGKVI